jgi:predicted tellurium resistance membrane protein TerC
MDILNYEIFFSIITLTFIEIILGIDNLIFIAIAVAKLPAKQRKKARIFGLSLALIIRVLMLLTLSWIMTLTTPLFYIASSAFSFKSFLLIFGGLFLIIKSAYEIIGDLIPKKHQEDKKSVNVSKTMIAAIAQISLIDFVFSFDSVITAIAMTNNIPVIVIAICISMIAMLMASEKISYFLKEYPSLKIVALAFIFMVGVILVADGLSIKISKGYLYFSLFFTLSVESLNIILRKNHRNHHNVKIK